MPSIAVVAIGPAVRQEVCRLLAGLPSCGDVRAATAPAELPVEPAPDVVVLDWPTSDVRGLPRTLPAGSRLVLLLDPADPPGLSPVLRAGARALLTRDLDPGDLLLALEAVERGGLHIAADLLDVLA